MPILYEKRQGRVEQERTKNEEWKEREGKKKTGLDVCDFDTRTVLTQDFLSFSWAGAHTSRARVIVAEYPDGAQFVIFQRSRIALGFCASPLSVSRRQCLLTVSLP